MPSHDLSALRIHREDDDPRRPRALRRLLIGGSAVVLTVIAGWFLWQAEWLPRAAPMVTVARPRIVQAGNTGEVLTATGYIVPQLRSTVSARISGRVEWLGVDEGSRVTRDEVIARLTSDDYRAQVAEAKASLAQARATLEQARSSEWEAKREQERQLNLLNDGITTQSDHDAAKRALDVATAGVAAAEEAVNAAAARLALTEANLEKTNIRAPFDGIVTNKATEIGEMVAAGAFSGQPTGGAIVTIADFSTLEMEADISESNISRVSVGQPALVSVEAVPGHRYRGVLRQIAPTADRQKAVVIAKVRILDLDEALVPDMSARVTFLEEEVSEEAASQPPRIFVPVAAIQNDDGTAYVLIVQDDRTIRLPVRLGENRGDLREVTSGLTGSETLVVSGAEGLTEGDRVRVSP